MNSSTPATRGSPRAACARAIRPCVLPPPYEVSSRNGGPFAPGAAQAPADIGEQVLQAAGRIGVGEEPDGIDVLGASAARDHLGEVGREVRLRHRPAHDVAAGTARVEDRRNAHGCLGPAPMQPARAGETQRADSFIGPAISRASRLRGAVSPTTTRRWSGPSEAAASACNKPPAVCQEQHSRAGRPGRARRRPPPGSPRTTLAESTSDEACDRRNRA